MSRTGSPSRPSPTASTSTAYNNENTPPPPFPLPPPPPPPPHDPMAPSSATAKITEEDLVSMSPMSSDKNGHASTSNVDAALSYLRIAKTLDTSSVDEAQLVRKIDWRLVPVMFACYTMQFVDKVNINYANVMGIQQDLKLKGNQFSWASSAFFISFLVAEMPTAYILQKFPAGKFLGVSVCLWGVTTACTAACSNFAGLLVVRVFLGWFEASIAPCLIVITSCWYTKREQVPRFAFWYSGLGIGQIFGGLVSYGFQYVPRSAPLAGWRAMFVGLGGITVLIGIWAFLAIPDTQMTADFLDDKEKAVAVKRVESNQTGIKSTQWKWSQVKELLGDVQVWMLMLCTILISVSSGVITTYSVLVIKTFGFTPKKSALLNMLSGIISILATALSGIYAGRTSQRGLWIACLCIPGILGGALMSFLPKSAKPGLLLGVYLVNAVVACLILIYSWLAANVSGHTKRLVANVVVSGSFSIGNIIGPQTFQARDAKGGYIPAKIAVLATQAAGGMVALALRQYYVRMNKKKAVAEREAEERGERVRYEGIEWMNLTDKENKTFRYVY